MTDPLPGDAQTGAGNWRAVYAAPPLPFTVAAMGVFSPARLQVRWHDRPRETTDELERLIAAGWQAKRAEARRSGGILFNGQMARYLSHDVREGTMLLDVGPTNYRDFVGTNLLNKDRVHEFGWHRFSNPIGTTATIITSDGRLLYGRRSERVAYHGGYLHTFGGALEQADWKPAARGAPRARMVDAFASVRRELDEEIHVGEQEINETVCLGLVRDREIFQPELIFDATVSLTRDELAARLDPRDELQEHTAVEACRDAPEAVVPFIQGAGKVAPVAVAAILLHGWRRWGKGWLDRAARTLT